MGWGWIFYSAKTETEHYNHLLVRGKSRLEFKVLYLIVGYLCDFISLFDSFPTSRTTFTHPRI